ncbi:hypothetical protein EC988_005618 [Linderina pennispora]|nr:hypothetical protein EC988_005618 [Linderina pennispora]
MVSITALLIRSLKHAPPAKRLPELPELVLVQIARHLLIDSPGSGGTARLGPIQRQLLPLMAVCRLWRNAAVPMYYSDAYLDLSIPAREHAAAQHVDRIVELGYARFVQRLRIGLMPSVFADHTQLAYLRGVLIPGRFVRARTLIVCLEGTQWDHIAKADGTRDVCQLLVQTAPTAKGLVFASQFAASLHRNSDALALLQSLEQGKRELSVLVTPATAHSAVREMQVPSGLVRLGVSADAFSSSVLAELLSRNAQTLQAVDLAHLTVVQLGLLCSKVAVFPRLRRLKWSILVDTEVNRIALDGETPFPSLTSLTATNLYPFSDSTLLLGCASTLRHLSLAVDEPLLEQLASAGALAASTYPQLQSLKMHHVSHSIRPIPEHLFSQVCNMARGASTVFTSMFGTDTNQAIELMTTSASVRHLRIPGQHLDLKQFALVARLYPSLESAFFYFSESFDCSHVNALRDSGVRRMLASVRIVSKITLLELNSPVHGRYCPTCTGEGAVLLAAFLPQLQDIRIHVAARNVCRTVFDSLVRAHKRSVYKARPHVRRLRLNVIAEGMHLKNY